MIVTQLIYMALFFILSTKFVKFVSQDTALISCQNFFVIYFKIYSPTFLRIIKAKSVQAYKPDPYVATLLNCSVWMFYGLPIVHPDSLLIITINGAGFIIEAIFITIFFTYSTWGGRVCTQSSPPPPPPHN